MTWGKRCAIIFLSTLSLISLVAGIIVDYKIITFDAVKQILPHNLELSSVQTMLVDFMAVSLIITLICVVVTYLVTDLPYSPLDIIENFALVFTLPGIGVLCAGIYGALHTPLKADRPWIIVCEIIFVLLSVINCCCIVTIKNDE